MAGQVLYAIAALFMTTSLIISVLAISQSQASCPQTLLGCTSVGCTSTVPITIKGLSLDRHATLTLNDDGDLDIEVSDNLNGGERAVYRLGTDRTISILDNVGVTIATIGPDCLSNLETGPD